MSVWEVAQFKHPRKERRVESGLFVGPALVLVPVLVPVLA